MSSRPNSTKVRRECFDAHKWIHPVTGRIMLTCHICKGQIDPAREKWDAEHTIRRVLSDDDSPTNVLPAHEACHDVKTKTDITENSKGKRVRDKHYGIVRKQGFRKPPEGYVFDWRAKRYVKAEELDS
jgi:5-methylcytosine-specific restriction endonuclease McrA